MKKRQKTIIRNIILVVLIVLFMAGGIVSAFLAF